MALHDFPFCQACDGDESPSLSGLQVRTAFLLENWQLGQALAAIIESSCKTGQATRDWLVAIEASCSGKFVMD